MNKIFEVKGKLYDSDNYFICLCIDSNIENAVRFCRKLELEPMEVRYCSYANAAMDKGVIFETLKIYPQKELIGIYD